MELTKRSGQQKRNLLVIEPGLEGPKTIFGCGGQGCRIISDYGDHELNVAQTLRAFKL